jgi:hypothetical protein
MGLLGQACACAGRAAASEAAMNVRRGIMR